MKRIALALVLLGCLCSPSSASDRTTNNLLGPVKSVEVSEGGISEKFGETVAETPTLVYIYTYDAAGNLVEQTWPWGTSVTIDGGNIQLFRTTAAFDEQGRKTHQTWYSPTPSAPLKKVTYLDRRLESTEFDGPSASRNTITILNAEGQPSEESRYDGEGKLERRTVYNYDSSGHMTDEVVYDGSGQKVTKTQYHYETGILGTTTQEIIFDAEEQELARNTSTIDGDGRTIFEERRGGYEEGGRHGISDLGDASRIVRAYSPEGRLLWQRTARTGPSLVFTVDEVFTYDDQGHLIGQERFSPDDRILNTALQDRFAFSYEFDLHGNWTKLVESKWVTKFGKSYFEPFKTTVRDIAYFQ